MRTGKALFDAHSHLPGGAGVPGLYTASLPRDCAELLSAAGVRPEVFPVFGIHPWHGDRVSFAEILPYLQQGVAVGEIGLDSVWTAVPLARQREIFLRQLDWAQEHRRPVVLHTKGCEGEILELIQRYTMSVLVHWYSDPEPALIEGYLARGCYFSIGPDVRTNPAVRYLARRVPREKLLVESDGLEGASWALGREVSPGEIPGLLRDTWAYVAELRGL
jgi:TatD DNase family protein